MEIYTIGHSNRTIRDFIELLKNHGVKRIVDVRTIPKSRHNPQFGEGRLKASLKKARIAYVHEPLLGGLRRARKDSPNTGWRNLSFRGFADYMQTDDFARGLEKLKRLAARGGAASHAAIMCAEAVPWRCHRSLIADALVKQGVRVFHITSRSAPSRHQPTSFLRMRRGKLTYPAPALPAPKAKPATRARR